MNPILVIQQLENADHYFCQVWSWKVSHSEMYIQLSIPGNTLFLFLPGVAYFAGPHAWHSMDFQLGTPDECLKRIRDLHLGDNLADRTIQDSFRLYTLAKPMLHVEIIAGDMELLTEQSAHARAPWIFATD